MRIVVVGGHTRNIGKTSVVAGLIHGLKSANWTAVKITQYGHGICSLDGKPCGCAPREHAFVLTEEKSPEGRGDTCRFLAAGAKRSLWLRVRQGQLVQAFPLLQASLRSDEFVLIESNSILSLINPALYLFVLDSSFRDFKPSALRHLGQADALVPVNARLDLAAWTGIDPRVLKDKPVFPVAARKYFSPQLCRFVGEKLDLPPFRHD